MQAGSPPSYPPLLLAAADNRLSLRMQGFIVFDYAKEYGTALAQLAQWLGEGKLKRQETIIKGGVAASEEAFKQLFQGGNIGKSATQGGCHRESTHG